MPKTTEQLRKMDPEDLTAHDFVALSILVGLVANTPSEAQRFTHQALVKKSRDLADMFLLQREERAS